MLKNTGKYLEDAVMTEFEKEPSVSFMYRRLYDTYTSGGRGIPAQPADFDLCFNGIPMFLECKTSNSERKALKTFSQYAGLKRWEMSGKRGYVLLHLYYFDELFLFSVADLDPELKSWPATLATRINHINQLVQTLCLKLLS
jgi:hypothetical protein